MKRKLLAIMLAMSLCVAVPFTCDAAEIEEPERQVENEQIEPRTTTWVTKADSDGNQYRLAGTVFRNAGVGQVATSFQVSYYHGGTGADMDRVNNYPKSCNAYAEVTLQGGGGNSFMKNQELKGASGESSATQSFIYTITKITGTHFFACNGLRYTFYSME